VLCQLVQLLLRRGANARQSNLRGKTPVDVAATDVIARLLRGGAVIEDNHVHHQPPRSSNGSSQMMSAVSSSDDSNQSASSLPAAASPAPASVNPTTASVSTRLTPGSYASSYICFTHLLHCIP